MKWGGCDLMSGGGVLMSLTIDTHTHRSLDAFVVVCLFVFVFRWRFLCGVALAVMKLAVFSQAGSAEPSE